MNIASIQWTFKGEWVYKVKIYVTKEILLNSLEALKWQPPCKEQMHKCGVLCWATWDSIIWIKNTAINGL